MLYSFSELNIKPVVHFRIQYLPKKFPVMKKNILLVILWWVYPVKKSFCFLACVLKHPVLEINFFF